MINLHRNQQHLAATLLLLSLLILLISSSSFARPLNDFNQLSATSNLELPSDRAVMKPEKKGHVLVVACGGKVNGPLILNMLPKGPVPPSAPSKGINNLNN
ncbi:unnamed protein product [Lathyrus oleraceus]